MTKKQIAALNTHSLWGEQCPHCGIQIPRGGYETCHACHKEFVWVRSGIDPIGETIFEGPCLPGQEEEAVAYLHQKAVEERAALATGCFGALIAIATIPVTVWLIFGA